MLRTPSLFAALLLCLPALAVRPDLKTLPIGLAPHEKPVERGREVPETDPPEGHIRSLGEWEEAEAVMTLWTNPSLVAALVDHGPVKLLADEARDRTWWDNWLTQNGIPKDKVSYFTVKTDSIWIRDYGPWWILDGQGRFGMVHNEYNRPRPNDNRVAAYLSRELGIPMFEPGLVHTGGNYYSDGLDDAFSSTLVYSENRNLAKEEIDDRMKRYLGITRYATSPLAPKITIEHLDTFGKLVTPDTWVFSEFPESSRYRADSERYLEMIKGLTSPYGTPYKIFRLKMRPVPGGGREQYRAYINSFISNRALYFPKYGDSIDDEVKGIYAEALPGYDIVGVDAQSTEWGDSVHCRNRNLLKRDTLFLFPTIATHRHSGARATFTVDVTVEAVPTPGAKLDGVPQLSAIVDGVERKVAMAASGGRQYRASLTDVAPGAKLALFVTAKDTAGVTKTAPPAAPELKIDVQVPER